MKRAFLVVICLAAVACMKPAAPSAPAKALESGIDPDAFDRAVRPQDDLFRHVNGAWLTKTEIPADKASYGAFDILFDKAQADLKAIVEDAGKSTAKAPGSEAQKIGDFYASFVSNILGQAGDAAVADLSKQFPGFDWAAWTTELGVNNVPAVVVSQPSYLKALAASVNELPVDAWKSWKAKERDESLRQQVLTNVHSPETIARTAR